MFRVSVKVFVLFSIIAGAAIGMLVRAELSRKVALTRLSECGFSFAIDEAIGASQVTDYWRYDPSPGFIDDPPQSLFQKIGLKTVGIELSYVGRVWARQTKESNPKLQNESLEPLKAFSQVKILDLRWNPIDDEGLRKITHLKQLEVLLLDGTSISDNGLKIIGGLKNLKSLSLNATHISDSGLKIISTLNQLEDISLAGTDVSDIGVALFSKSKNLHSLNLTRTKVSGKSFKEFATNHKFKILSLGNSKFDRRHLGDLISAFPNLEELYLDSTNIEDSDTSISKLKRLVHLDVSNTEVGDKFIATLAGLPLIGIYAHSTNVTSKSKRIFEAMDRIEFFELSDEDVWYRMDDDD